ncbi:MAG: DUF2130 domain-containing protein [Paludibacteraceae bacterium]|nr:DUF2130 domain-containing protein [Paludibacteraceae bacterium]
MKELKCPHCGNVFAVDENDYAALISQVKNAEFNAEVTRRIHELEQNQQARQQAEKQAEEARRQAEAMRQQTQLRDKESEIALLKQQIQNFEVAKKAAVQEAVMLKDQKIQQLESDRKLAESQALLKAQSMKDDYETRLKMAKEQVEYYKDMKVRLSTKMVGETLEQHCATLFEQNLRLMMPNAYFEKDNDVVEGTKGDFVFRDKSDDGVEYISIMFEMKNENEETATKHKNEDFFAKLDADRKKKNCEYAVLVSMLEPESELYNGGIVDVSHRFEKMYVIRPQFFIPLITLLCQANKKSIEAKRELMLVRQQQVDVTNFEEKLMNFKDGFTRNVRLANDRFRTAIEEIDKTIQHLTKVRENLVKSSDNLDAADKKLQDVTIKRLTYGNPTMKAMFDAAGKD